MGRNLGPLNIKDSYEGLVQISGSSRDILTDGSGSSISNLTVTASYATTAGTVISASYALTSTSASHALNADNAISSSYAVTASYALNAGTTINTGSFMITGSVLTDTLTFTKGDGSTFDLTVSATASSADALVTASISDATITFTKGNASTFPITVNNVVSSSYALTATSASHAISSDTSISASYALSASFATTASYALNVTPINTGSFYYSSSVADATATFYQGDGSTESLTIDNVANAVSASHAISSDTSISASYALSSSYAAFATTASYALNVTPINTGSFYISSSVLDATATFNKGDGTTDSLTINNVANAVSASYALSSSYALTSTSASHAISSDTSISASYALSASFATNALSSSYAVTASYAANAGGGELAGLITGSGGINTIISAPHLTTNPAVASAASGIAIGNNARNYSTGAIVIGDDAQNYDNIRYNSVYIGKAASGAQNSVGIGWNSAVLSDSSVGIGRDSYANGSFSVAIGYDARCSDNALGTTRQIAIGYNTRTFEYDEINIGKKFLYNSGSNGKINLADDTIVNGNLAVNGAVTINGLDIPILINSATLGSGSAVDNLGQEAVGTTDAIEHMVFLTQAEYDGLTPDDNTFYAISGSTTLNTGSFYYSSSVVDSTATFYQGDGTSESLTINTINGDITTGGVTGTVNIDFEDGNFFTVTPTGTVTITPTNTLVGRSQTVSIVIDNAASQTVNFSGILFAEGTAPTITAAGVDIVTLVSFGTTVYGTAVQNLS